jgi:hypothetical protein
MYGMRTLLIVLGATLLYPLRSHAQGAVSAGILPTAGPLGIEAVWTDAEYRAGLAVAAGVFGIGARGLLFYGNSTVVGPSDARHYLSAGYAATPWGISPGDAKGAVVVEVGEQLWYRGRGIFVDMGIGGAVAQGGSWAGNTLGLTVRFQMGLTL